MNCVHYLFINKICLKRLRLKSGAVPVMGYRTTTLNHTQSVEVCSFIVYNLNLKA